MELSKRQLDIIHASGRLITQHGLSGLTIKNLAAEMGFVESALYRHFKSKEDIIVLLIRYLYQNVQERLEPIIESEGTAEQKIRQIFDSHFEFVEAHRHFVIVMTAEGIIDESETIKTEAQKILLFMSQILAKLLNEILIEHPESQKLDTIAQGRLLLGGFRMMLFQWKLMKFQFDITHSGRQLIDNYFILLNAHQYNAHD